MSKTVMIGQRPVGPGHPVLIIAEIGINHNGDMDIARGLIDAALAAGCDVVKFQKRTVDVVYSADELERPRESPFGTTNGALKHGLELGAADYRAIDQYCKARGILWTASCWDAASVDFIDRLDPPFFKIASACLTDDGLLRHHRAKGKPLLVSTGMSTMDQLRHAVDVLGSDDLILLHCTSAYPAKTADLGLRTIETLTKEFDCPIGYSGHEVGLAPTVAAVALGACVVERHITLDRSMWGSDQAASVEPSGFERLVKDVRAIEEALGDGVKRVYQSEELTLRKLRRV